MQNRIGIVLGKKGKGKTTLIRNIVEDMDNVTWFDPMHQFSQLRPAQFAREFHGFVRHHSPDQYALYLSRPVEALRKGLQGRRFYRILYEPSPALDEETHLAYIMRTLVQRYKRIGERSVLVIDEVDILPPNTPVLTEAVKRGRHFLIDQLYVTRRPHEIGRMLTSQADDLYIFQTTEPRDLKYLQDYSIPRETLGAVRELQVGEFLHVDVANGSRTTLYRTGP